MMKFRYGLSNVLGAVYRNGNICFTPDGKSVISPAGNRLILCDLRKNKTKTLPIESRYNYNAIALSPDGSLLIAINERGEAQLISMISLTIVHKHKFVGSVNYLKFSPDGHHFAVAVYNSVFVFKSPGKITGEYNPFVLEKHYIAAFDDITWVDWSSDATFLAVGCKDNTTKVFSIKYLPKIHTYVLGGHTESIVGCFFERSSLNMITVSKNGQLCMWKCSIDVSNTMRSLPENIAAPNEKRLKETLDLEYNSDQEQDIRHLPNENSKMDQRFFYEKTNRHYLADEERKNNSNVYVTAAGYNLINRVMVVAFSSASFYLYELPDVNIIHCLSISFAVSSLCFNLTGDWIALASSEQGQLLVWEWQSEQYVLKQQGHNGEISCISYSPDGQYIATGSADSKIKLWNTTSGFCFVTFSEHTSAVSDVAFSKSKQFLVSSSFDGTVRAYDIIRYRNFRTFTSPRPVQFSCVAVDYSGELVVAGGHDVFDIYLWSMKLGTLLEVLSGHEGPVTAIAFSPVPASSLLITGSWDKTVKIWNCLENNSANETIDMLSDVTCVSFKPNGNEIAVGTLNGNITMFDIKTLHQASMIEGQRDLHGERWQPEQPRMRSRFFYSIEYTADGNFIIAGGLSRFICIYYASEGMLLKKFEITSNNCIKETKVNLKGFGNIVGLKKKYSLNIKENINTTSHIKSDIKVFSVRFSPTGQHWAAGCSEGLLVFSLNSDVVFDPLDLSVEVTPKSITNSLKNNEYCRALTMALRLNEPNLTMMVIERIPANNIDLICSSLTTDKAQPLLNIIIQLLRKSPHIEFHLKWLCSILTKHGNKNGVFQHNHLLSVHDTLSKKYDALSKICDFNKYTLYVIRNLAKV